MVDSEGRVGGVERGAGGEPVENLKVDESRLVSVSRDEAEREHLIDRWTKSLNKSKDLFKEKLVGGKPEHKKEFNKIVSESKEELRKINAMSPEKQVEAYRKLEAESERRLKRLIKEVGSEAEDMKDGKVGRMAGEENRTKLVWQKWQEVEVAKERFKRELSSGRSSEASLSEAQGALVNKQTELDSLMGEMGDEFKTGEEIRELYKLEVGNEIQSKAGDGVEGAQRAKEAREMIDEMIERIDSPERAKHLKEHELKEAVRDYTEALNLGHLSNEEEVELEPKISKIIEQIKKIEVERKNRQINEIEQEGIDEGEHYLKMLENPDLTNDERKKISDHVANLPQITEKSKKFLEDMKNNDIEAVNRYIESKETKSNKKRINDFVDTYRNMDRETTSSEERWKGIKTVADKWEIHEEGSRTIMHPDQAKEEAMREVITYAINRLVKRGGKKAVTEEDIREWAFGKVELMIKSGDEATGYSARQHISQISQIFAADKLDFNKELGKKQDSRGSPVSKEFVNTLTDDHCKAITNETRDMIESMMAVAQFSNVYNHSQSAEDVVRASAALEMWHIGDMLKARGVSREIKGKVGFYAVEMDKNHKVVMTDEANIGNIEYKKPKTGYMDVYEKVVNGDGGEVKMFVDGKEYSLDKLSQMLDVEGDVNVRPAELMNLMNQERFANQLLSIGGIKDRAREELVREAIKIELGLVDIDGNVNLEKIKELVGEGEVRFTIGDKEIDPSKMKLRMHLAVTELDGQAVDWDRGIKEKNFAEVEKHFKWAEKLAEGTWRFSGTGIGAWDKNHEGNSEDWNRKILHLVPYLSKFGVGTAFLRETCSTDFTDIFSQRGKELILGKIDKAIEFYDRRGKVKVENDPKTGETKMSEEEKEAKGLLNLLLTDKDGFLMARSRMIDLLNHYNKLKEEEKKGDAKKGDANKFMKDRLKRLAEDKYGEREGNIKFNKAWEVIKKEKFWVDGKETGFKGYLEKVKEAYRFENFDWGITWNERIVKEFQYQVAADKFRGALIGWLMKPNSTEAMITAIQTPAYYGEESSTKRFKMMFEKYKDYFAKAGLGGRWYPVLTKGYANKDFNKNPDVWDGVLKYQKEWKAPGFFAAREIGAKPFLPSHFESLIVQAQRAKVLSFVEDAHELRNEVLPLDLGKLMRKVDIGIDKASPGLKQLLKITRFALMGGDVPNELGGGMIKKLWGSVYFAGILGFLLKKIRELFADLNRHKWDIAEGTAKEGLTQVGEGLKN